MTEKKYVYADENGNVTILTEDDLPKCPISGGISPRVMVIGTAKKIPEETLKVDHINCRCSLPIKRGDVE